MIKANIWIAVLVWIVAFAALVANGFDQLIPCFYAGMVVLSLCLLIEVGYGYKSGVTPNFLSAGLVFRRKNPFVFHFVLAVYMAMFASLGLLMASLAIANIFVE